eukprot:6204851-Pleurochrysis_carterae.AAC.1
MRSHILLCAHKTQSGSRTSTCMRANQSTLISRTLTQVRLNQKRYSSFVSTFVAPNLESAASFPHSFPSYYSAATSPLYPTIAFLIASPFAFAFVLAPLIFRFMLCLLREDSQILGVAHLRLRTHTHTKLRSGLVTRSPFERTD